MIGAMVHVLGKAGAKRIRVVGGSGRHESLEEVMTPNELEAAGYSERGR